jgi:hypothetical protein
MSGVILWQAVGYDCINNRSSRKSGHNVYVPFLEIDGQQISSMSSHANESGHNFYVPELISMSLN